MLLAVVIYSRKWFSGGIAAWKVLGAVLFTLAEDVSLTIMFAISDKDLQTFFVFV